LGGSLNLKAVVNFGSLNISESKNYWCQFFEKNPNNRIIHSSCFRNLKDLIVFMNKLAINSLAGSLTF
jgi:hypothetical protein